MADASSGSTRRFAWRLSAACVLLLAGAAGSSAQDRWVYENGRWVKAAATTTAAARDPAAPEPKAASPVATAPAAVQPGTAQPATAPAGSRAAGLLETIEEALRLTDAQADAYRLAMARNLQIDDPVALTLFLRRVANLPKLPPEEMGNLDRPAVRNLLADPRRYAGRPISLRVLVNRVWKWVPGVDFTATADWTRDDGPVYRYDCLNAEANSPASEPVCILSPLEPKFVLGRPGKDGNEGEWIYSNLPRVQVAGVFFKVYAGREQLTRRPRDYPVLLAWQIRPAPEVWLAPSAETGMQALILGIVLLAGIALYFLWRLRQSARRMQFPLARPHNPLQDRREEEKASAEDQADPGLAAAAEEFRKKGQVQE